MKERGSDSNNEGNRRSQRTSISAPTRKKGQSNPGVGTVSLRVAYQRHCIAVAQWPFDLIEIAFCFEENEARKGKRQTTNANLEKWYASQL